MGKLFSSAERFISVPTEIVYRCIADFQHHHQHFLPSQFGNYLVEEGGFGAGTVVSFTSTLGGRLRKFRVKIEEPEQNVLIERDLLSDLTTKTTIIDQENGCVVRFETIWESSKGFIGTLERIFAPKMMQKMYIDELTRLEHYAKQVL